MRHRLFYASGLLALATLVLPAAAEAQTTAVGPYYATPSWDQTFACNTLATCPRFIVLSNFKSEAVLDRETGLVWERYPDPTPQISWQAAVNHCLARVVANRAGWRAPSIQDLLTLVNPEVTSGLALPPGHPFSNVQETRYWSATVFGTVEGFMRTASFEGNNSGEVIATAFAENLTFFPVWCVRGGQSADAQ